MAEEVILKVGVQGTGEGEQKIKSLKAQLKEMKNELLGLDEGSDRFKQLSKSAGELQDRIGDVNDKVRALSSDTKRLDALVGVGSAIAGAFQGAQGAMALFGSNSKEVEKAIQNIIAVQGILNGVQQVGQFLTAKGIVQDALYATGKRALALATKTWTAIQWALNAALLANPIGLIIAGVAALTAGIVLLAKNFKAVVNWITDLENLKMVALALMGPIGWIILAWKELNSEERKLANIREEESKKNTERYKKAVAELKEKRRLEQEAFEEAQTQFDLTIARAEAEGKNVQKLKEQKLQAILDEKKAMYQHNIDLINLMVQRYEFEAQLRGKSLDEFLKSIGIDYEATRKSIEDQLQGQKDAIYSAETDIIALKRQSNKTQVDDTKKKLEEQLKLEQERLERERELQAFLIDRRLEADALFNKRLAEEKQARLDAEYDALEAQIDAENALKEQQLADDKARQDERQKLGENFAQASIDLANTVFTLTNALGKQDEASKLKRAKRQFEINKALAISDATISTINGVVNALTEKSILPAPLSTIARAVNATAVALAGASNIAKIASSKFEGGSVSPTIGGGGDAGGSASNIGNVTPNINAIPAGSTLLNQPTQKVVVVESDITKVQKKVNVIESQATFG